MRLLGFISLFTIFNTPYAQQYSPNQYQIYNYHKNWYTFYSTAVAGASTLNSDATGVLVMCEIRKNNCTLRIDVHGQCLWNGTQKVQVSIDGKNYGTRSFACSGRPVGGNLGLNLSMLIGKLSSNLDLGMKKGSRINFDFYDATNSPMGMQASLMGYTSARNELASLKNKLKNN